MERSFRRIGRAHRGLRGDHLTAGGPGQNPRAEAPEAEAQRRMAQVAAILFRDAKAPAAGRRKIAVTAAIAGADRLPSDRPLEGHGRNSNR